MMQGWAVEIAVQAFQQVEDGGEERLVRDEDDERLARVGEHLQHGVQVGEVGRLVVQDADGGDHVEGGQGFAQAHAARQQGAGEGRHGFRERVLVVEVGDADAEARASRRAEAEGGLAAAVEDLHAGRGGAQGRRRLRRDGCRRGLPPGGSRPAGEDLPGARRIEAHAGGLQDVQGSLVDLGALVGGEQGEAGDGHGWQLDR